MVFFYCLKEFDFVDWENGGIYPTNVQSSFLKGDDGNVYMVLQISNVMPHNQGEYACRSYSNVGVVNSG